MKTASVRLMLRLWSRKRILPWSPESRVLVRLAREAAAKSPADPGLSNWERLRPAATKLSETRKGRERIAKALGASDFDAWLLQGQLKGALTEPDAE